MDPADSGKETHKKEDVPEQAPETTGTDAADGGAAETAKSNDDEFASLSDEEKERVEMEVNREKRIADLERRVALGDMKELILTHKKQLDEVVALLDGEKGKPILAPWADGKSLLAGAKKLTSKKPFEFGTVKQAKSFCDGLETKLEMAKLLNLGLNNKMKTGGAGAARDPPGGGAKKRPIKAEGSAERNPNEGAMSQTGAERMMNRTATEAKKRRMLLDRYRDSLSGGGSTSDAAERRLRDMEAANYDPRKEFDKEVSGKSGGESAPPSQSRREDPKDMSTEELENVDFLFHDPLAAITFAVAQHQGKPIEPTILEQGTPIVACGSYAQRRKEKLQKGRCQYLVQGHRMGEMNPDDIFRNPHMLKASRQQAMLILRRGKKTGSIARHVRGDPARFNQFLEEQKLSAHGSLRKRLKISPMSGGDSGGL